MGPSYESGFQAVKAATNKGSVACGADPLATLLVRSIRHASHQGRNVPVRSSDFFLTSLSTSSRSGVSRLMKSLHSSLSFLTLIGSTSSGLDTFIKSNALAKAFHLVLSSRS